eukprot:CAMPEP_0198519732 /NCGR_PEP_ID=MMETSP1462-20131121/19891_1 /TAXON_ID=1333877 /ORGANISM="Brandtodinium nutriculum, Strain RCC3387" /LENGTH=96 /DNA_ID=CAMNT_0044249347 /DNA_START=107 /DNA_END=396 /DNA_ORIENTATION=-
MNMIDTDAVHAALEFTSIAAAITRAGKQLANVAVLAHHCQHDYAEQRGDKAVSGQEPDDDMNVYQLDQDGNAIGGHSPELLQTLKIRSLRSGMAEK